MNVNENLEKIGATTTKPNSNPNFGERNPIKDDNLRKICRICLSENNENEIFLKPCNCSGSL